MSLLSVLVSLAFAHPGPFRAHFLGLQDETFSAQHVEEDLADEVRRRGPGHFQARAETFVTGAVHHARNAPVEEAVTRLESRYEEGTGGVVSTATSVRGTKTTEIRVFGGTMASAAPLRPRDHQQVPPGPTFASSLLAAVVARRVLQPRVRPATMLSNGLIPRPGPDASAPTSQFGRRREPGEVLRNPRGVLVLLVNVEHLDRGLVIVIVIVIVAGVRTRRAGAVVPVDELLVDAVGQRATLVYQLQLSAGLLQPDLPQCYVRISPIDDGLLGADPAPTDYTLELAIFEDPGDRNTAAGPVSGRFHRGIPVRLYGKRVRSSNKSSSVRQHQQHQQAQQHRAPGANDSRSFPGQHVDQHLIRERKPEPVTGGAVQALP